MIRKAAAILVRMPEEDSERHFDIHADPEVMAGHYANFANVSHSDYEFTVTFARVDHEVDEEAVPGVVVSRINLSPRFMRELIDAMEDNFSKWQTREGIKNLPEFDDGAGGRRELAPELHPEAQPLLRGRVGSEQLPASSPGVRVAQVAQRQVLLQLDERLGVPCGLERERVRARLDRA